MKPSRYNVIIPYNDNFSLVFNGITGSFLVLDKNALNLLKKAQNSKKISFEYKDAENDFQKMKNFGIIVDEDFDEKKYIKVLNRREVFSTDNLITWIAPTFNCNLNCVYCFEGKKRARMSPETQSKTLEFIKNKIKKSSNYALMWFGGEPLLEKDIIWNMTRKIHSYCTDYECSFYAGIITNGYLLDKKTAENLVKNDINYLQTTLDGPKEVHDKKRMQKNGKGTYDVILQNIVDVTDIIPKIVVRVNIDKENVGKIDELLDDLIDAGLRNKIGIFYMPVWSDTPACKDMSESCVSDMDFLKIEQDLLKKTLEKGFGMSKYPLPSIGGCGLLHENSFFIDPDGDLYSCVKTVGFEKEKIGDIYTPLKMNKNRIKWLSWDPFSFEKCNVCKFLPICMGGCPYEFYNKELKEPVCNNWKNTLEAVLKLYFQSIYSKKIK